MAKRTEVVELSEEDIKEAVANWLLSKYAPSRTTAKPWKVVIHHHPVYDEIPYFTATAERETD